MRNSSSISVLRLPEVVPCPSTPAQKNDQECFHFSKKCRKIALGFFRGQAALKISHRVLIESRYLKPFHSIEQYRVSNPQYPVSLILKNCDFFALFSPKKSYFKAKNTHFWQFKSPRLPPPLIQEQFVKKCHKKRLSLNSPKKRFSCSNL